MEIVGAAALIAVGIVIAAVLYGRTHSASPAASAAAAERETTAALQAALAERGSALETRERALTGRAEAVGAAPPTADRAPLAVHVPGAFEPAEGGVDGAGGQFESPPAAPLQRLDDRVPMQLPAVERGQQQRVQVTP